MYKKSIIFIAIVFCFLEVRTYSQASGLVHLTIGYSLAIGDLRGDLNNPADSNTYLLKDGMNYGLTIKKAYGRNGNFRITGIINFAIFKQTRHIESPEVIKDAKLRLDVLTLGIGGEWSFSPRKSKLNPFIGAELCLNYFTGSFTWSDEFQNSTLTSSATLNLKPSGRFGVQIGGGVDFQIHQSVGFIAGAKYNWANILGKSRGQDSRSEYYLNDGELTKSPNYLSSRNITFLQIYGGLSYYFGR